MAQSDSYVNSIFSAFNAAPSAGVTEAASGILAASSLFPVLNCFNEYVNSFSNLNKLQRSKSERKASFYVKVFAADFSRSPLVFNINVFAVLAQFGVFNAAAASILTPAAPITVAASSLVATGIAFSRYREAKKLTDPIYFIEDQLQKVAFLTDSTQNFEKTNRENEGKLKLIIDAMQQIESKNSFQFQRLKIEKRLLEHTIKRQKKRDKHYQTELKRIRIQLTAMASVQLQETNHDVESQRIKKIKDSLQESNIILNEDTSSPEFQKQLKLYNYLTNKKEVKAKQRKYQFIALAVSTIGLSLIAAAAFPGPHSVICLALGIAICIVAAGFQFYSSRQAKRYKSEMLTDEAQRDLQSNLMSFFEKQYFSLESSGKQSFDNFDSDEKDNFIRKFLPDKEINENNRDALFEKAKKIALYSEVAFELLDKRVERDIFLRAIQLLYRGGFRVPVKEVEDLDAMDSLKVKGHPMIFKVGEEYYFYGKHRFNRWKAVKITNQQVLDEIGTVNELAVEPGSDLFNAIKSSSLHRHDKDYMDKYLKELECTLTNQIALNKALNPNYQLDSWGDVQHVIADHQSYAEMVSKSQMDSSFKP